MIQCRSCTPFIFDAIHYTRYTIVLNPNADAAVTTVVIIVVRRHKDWGHGARAVLSWISTT